MATGETIPLKRVATVLFDDGDGKIKASGKCPLVIDPSGNAVTFLRYRDINYLNVLAQNDMQPNNIRLAVLGALRFGKPLVLDLNETDTFDVGIERFDAVQKGLMESVMDRSITQEEKFEKLFEDSDPPEYKSGTYTYMVDNFKFFLVTSKPGPSADLLKKCYPITIE